MNAIGRPVTLQMLADDLGVSVSTVSRVLNSPTDKASRWGSQETVARIRSRAAETGYIDAPHAGKVRRARSGVVGVLMARLRDVASATMYEGVEEAAAEAGLVAVVASSLDVPDYQRLRAKAMADRHVDGLIFGDAHFDHEVVDEVAATGLPVVLIARRAGQHPSVTCDDPAGGRLAGSHLASTGRRHPVILAGTEVASTAAERTAGALEAFEGAGVEVPEERVMHGADDAAGGRAAMKAVMDAASGAGGTRPDCVFATNDLAAMGAIQAVGDAGLRVPDDVAVVGYDDTDLAAALPVPLTSVRSQMHEIGRRGLQLLVQAIGGDTPESQRLEPELVVRASA